MQYFRAPHRLQLSTTKLTLVQNTTTLSLNSMLYQKLLAYKTFKAFANDKFNATKMISVFDWAENIVGKGENPAFSPFPTMFPSVLFFQGR